MNCTLSPNCNKFRIHSEVYCQQLLQCATLDYRVICQSRSFLLHCHVKDKTAF